MQTPILENYPHAEAEENDALLPGASERRTHRRAPRAFLPTFTRWKANPMWSVVNPCFHELINLIYNDLTG
jgi:hypothetical protein